LELFRWHISFEINKSCEIFFPNFFKNSLKSIFFYQKNTFQKKKKAEKERKKEKEKKERKRKNLKKNKKEIKKEKKLSEGDKER
jgi:hypothetical protein